LLGRLLLRVTVIIAYAAGLNAAFFVPLYQLRAQPVQPGAPIATGEAKKVSDGSKPSVEYGTPLGHGADNAVDLNKALQNLVQNQGVGQSSAGRPTRPHPGSAQATTSDFAPAGAKDLGVVDPATGKLTFDVPIASVGGNTTPAF
jgi:hypothetical protein